MLCFVQKFCPKSTLPCRPSMDAVDFFQLKPITRISESTPGFAKLITYYESSFTPYWGKSKYDPYVFLLYILIYWGLMVTVFLVNLDIVVAIILFIIIVFINLFIAGCCIKYNTTNFPSPVISMNAEFIMSWKEQRELFSGNFNKISLQKQLSSIRSTVYDEKQHYLFPATKCSLFPMPRRDFIKLSKCHTIAVTLNNHLFFNDITGTSYGSLSHFKQFCDVNKSFKLNYRRSSTIFQKDAIQKIMNDNKNVLYHIGGFKERTYSYWRTRWFWLYENEWMAYLLYLCGFCGFRLGEHWFDDFENENPKGTFEIAIIRKIYSVDDIIAAWIQIHILDNKILEYDAGFLVKIISDFVGDTMQIFALYNEEIKNYSKVNTGYSRKKTNYKPISKKRVKSSNTRYTDNYSFNASEYVQQ